MTKTIYQMIFSSFCLSLYELKTQFPSINSSIFTKNKKSFINKNQNEGKIYEK